MRHITEVAVGHQRLEVSAGLLRAGSRRTSRRSRASDRRPTAERITHEDDDDDDERIELSAAASAAAAACVARTPLKLREFAARTCLPPCLSHTDLYTTPPSDGTRERAYLHTTLFARHRGSKKIVD